MARDYTIILADRRALNDPVSRLTGEERGGVCGKLIDSVLAPLIRSPGDMGCDHQVFTGVIQQGIAVHGRFLRQYIYCGPARWPESNASTRAAESMSAPRAVLINMASGLIRPIVS